jgi:hypothetical protein
MMKIPALSTSLIFLFLFSISCARERADMSPKGNPMPAKAIAEVLKEHSRAILSIPGVVGTGQGLCDGQPCIKVYVIQETPELDQKIPRMLEGYPVTIEETGEIRALPKKK